MHTPTLQYPSHTKMPTGKAFGPTERGLGVVQVPFARLTEVTHKHTVVWPSRPYAHHISSEASCDQRHRVFEQLFQKC